MMSVNVMCYEEKSFRAKDRKSMWKLPCTPVANSLPSDAGNAGYIPGQGTKIPHAVEQHHSPNAPEPTPHK